VAIQYAKSKEQFFISPDKDNSDSWRAFLARITSMIKQWKAYLTLVVDEKLLLDKEKVDAYVVMIEHARKIMLKKRFRTQWTASKSVIEKIHS
jgi:hypothetical protein